MECGQKTLRATKYYPKGKGIYSAFLSPLHSDQNVPVMAGAGGIGVDLEMEAHVEHGRVTKQDESVLLCETANLVLDCVF